MNSKSRVLGVIPARYGSTRFPGKMLHPIMGKSLLERTHERAKQSSLLDTLVVASDDARIHDHVLSFGGTSYMTSSTCPTGSDRIAEALKTYSELDSYDIIVNIQGDHPCLSPHTMNALVSVLQNSPDAVMATAVMQIECESDYHNPHIVKCVMDTKGNALYFSRALIPFGKNGVQPGVNYYHHLGIYAFRRDFLLKFGELPATPLQMAEDLEQLKVLEHGYRIKLVIVDDVAIGVDVPEDVKKVEKHLCMKQNISLSPAASSPL
jgi:3-deoxy-manno-octulosonate cytidylyltransferase (CMP-KDO synthetase)